MSVTSMFKNLRAPLSNPIWAWGAESQDRKAIILRVWQDETCKLSDGKRGHRLTNREFCEDNEAYKSKGWPQRLRHIQQIKNKTPGYCIIVIARDTKEVPRKIKGFIDDAIFPIIDLKEENGDTWAVLEKKITIKDYLASS